MKILLRVFGGLFVLVVAVVVAGAAVVLSIDPNEYRERLSAEAKAATGRDLIIKGDLRVGISLVPTIVANDVSFSNAAWGSRPDMASIKKLEAALEIIPLLSGNIRISRVVLVEPDILLEISTDGRPNWDFSSASAVSSVAPGGPAGLSRSTSEAESGSPTIPTIISLAIDKARFRFNDMKSKEDLTLILDKVRVGDVATGNKLKIEIAGGYNDTPFQLQGNVDSVDRMMADVNDFGIDLEAAALAATVKIKGIVAKPMSAPRLGLDFSLVGKDMSATLDAAKALAPGLKDIAIPSIGSFDIAGKATGSASAPAIENLLFALGSTDAFKLTGTGKGANNTYSIDKFMAEIYGSDLAGSLSATLGGRVPEIKATLTSHKLDLADIEKLMKGAKAETPSSPASSAPASAPATAPKAVSKDANDGRVFPADPLPLDGLKAVNATVTFKGDRFVAKGTTIDAIDATVNLTNGKLILDPFAAMVSEGKVSGKITVDASGATPTIENNVMVDKLNLGKLLKERDITDVLTGKASAKINTKGTGASVRALMASLNGDTEVVMEEGRIANGYVEILAADLAKLNRGGDAKINCFVSRFELKQGIATSKALLFDTEKMTIAGGGMIDLGAERLELGLEPQPKDSSLISLAVPLQVTGTFSSPRVAPTTASVLKGIAGMAVTGLTPFGIVAALTRQGSGEQNPCLSALKVPQSAASATKGQAKGETKSAPAAQPAPSNNQLESLRGLFGGKK